MPKKIYIRLQPDDPLYVPLCEAIASRITPIDDDIVRARAHSKLVHLINKKEELRLSDFEEWLSGFDFSAFTSRRQEADVIPNDVLEARRAARQNTPKGPGPQ